MEAIKPRQIINYDAGIVLGDLHQQRKAADNTNQRDTEYRATLISTKNRTHEQQPAAILLQQMIEQSPHRS